MTYSVSLTSRSTLASTTLSIQSFSCGTSTRTSPTVRKGASTSPSPRNATNGLPAISLRETAIPSSVRTRSQPAASPARPMEGASTRASTVAVAAAARTGSASRRRVRPTACRMRKPAQRVGSARRKAIVSCERSGATYRARGRRAVAAFSIAREMHAGPTADRSLSFRSSSARASTAA